ncbi:MAG: hypothetical protein M0Q91_08210 [Methanoregula sp.]|jgi:hypothetical protein|nr:hypothetical protein [Methanoregula sp.]
MTERKEIRDHDMRQKLKMDFLNLNKYSTAAILLLGAAAFFIDLALLISPKDLTTSVFVISGMVCLITGIFTLTFSWTEPVDPRLIGILPAQGCMNLCSTMHLLDITGNAFFLPPRITGETRVMQFNPTDPYQGIGEDFSKGSFRERGPPGIVTIPLCDLLIRDLKNRNALIIPDTEGNLTQLLRESIEDVFQFTSRVSVRWHGSTVTITFHDYRSIDGCKVIAQGSPNCCPRNPCPMCSLCGALIAEGLDKIVSLNQCTISSSSRDVTAIFSIGSPG